MRRNKGFIHLIIPVAIVSVFLLGVLIYVTLRSGDSPAVPSPISPTPVVQKDSTDLPLLYPEIEWKLKESKLVNFRDQDNNLIELQARSYESDVINNNEEGFISYYQEELNKRGWLETWFADGPGGIFYGFQKGKYYFQFGVQSRKGNAKTVFIEYN